MSKFLWLFTTVFVVSSGLETNDVVTVGCGKNRVEKFEQNQFYSFNQEVTEGSIEFTGNVFSSMKTAMVYIYRGPGGAYELNRNNSLRIEFNENDKKTNLLNNKQDNGWSATVSYNAQPLVLGNENKIMVKIFKDKFVISVNDVRIQTYQRHDDEGYYIKGAAIGGSFQTRKVALECYPSRK